MTVDGLRCILYARISGGSRGPGGPEPPPIFGKVSFIFYIVYNVWKNIFEIEFGFYSGRNPRSFCKYACVCESKWWPLLFFCSVKAPF